MRHCSAAMVAATSRRVSGSSSRPSNRSAIQPGMLAPQAAENFCTWAKLVTGRMPGRIGTVMPAWAARSRKARNTAGSKKY
ncbi:hypothetical protein amb0430 [Paramagnetospirillum magneticum AMB-1]|uniref:Uncharacterized protein n=1 Tax=Paramagnetospirillum magneticum (strain ATCC 700264 / AMB-1) TaxID=342108 RepID=Q2WA91_PARM1|nr:hypothetical protein amb0430 [Paramagnetospirillum magneticum AMB-1]